MTIELTGGRADLFGAVFRYDVLERLARIANNHQVGLLAFGFGSSELRLVLTGERSSITDVVRGLKVGTARAASHWGLMLRALPNWRVTLGEHELFEAVMWAHRAPLDAGVSDMLSSPWSSLRDALGYRRSQFYDVDVLRRFIDPKRLVPRSERYCDSWYSAPKDDLSGLLRLSAGVLGVLPSHRRCFRLFVHVAREKGFSNRSIAAALTISARRVRQIASDPEPDLVLVYAALEDRRLAQVP